MNCLRFHVSSGPNSLFERVRYKFRDPRVLKFNAQHFVDRAVERAAPTTAFGHFDAREWELMTVEVRADTGKFVSTAWQGCCNLSASSRADKPMGLRATR